MRINRISIAIILLKKFASLVSFGLVKLELDRIGYTTFYIVKCKPINPHLCFFLALGCWISVNAEILESTENFSLIPGTKPFGALVFRVQFVPEATRA